MKWKFEANDKTYLVHHKEGTMHYRCIQRHEPEIDGISMHCYAEEKGRLVRDIFNGITFETTSGLIITEPAYQEFVLTISTLPAINEQRLLKLLPLCVTGNYV